MAGEHGRAAASILSAWRWKSARVPLLALAGIAGQLDAVDGEHLAADEPLAVADEQDVLEQRPDLAVQGADEAAKVVKCGALSPD
jgi:hypothetical protein